MRRERDLKKLQKEEQKRKQAIKNFEEQETFLFFCFDITSEAVEETIFPYTNNFFQAYMDMFVKRRAEIFDNLRRKEKDGLLVNPATI